jgi:predicted Holliday junction resolvase-like endonuclease
MEPIVAFVVNAVLMAGCVALWYAQRQIKALREQVEDQHFEIERTKNAVRRRDELLALTEQREEAERSAAIDAEIRSWTAALDRPRE